jgi:hypothetical protein
MSSLLPSLLSARFAGLMFSAFVLLAPAASRAEIVEVPDPDKWIEGAMNNLTSGRTEDFARDFLRLIDKSNDFESFHRDVAVLGQIGKPVFVEKVSDEKFGTSLRQVIFVALFRQVDYIYFRFVVKRNRTGYAITNFQYKDEAANLFPPNFLQR